MADEERQDPEKREPENARAGDERDDVKITEGWNVTHDASGAELQGGSFAYPWSDAPVNAEGTHGPADLADMDAGGGYTRDDIHIATTITNALAQPTEPHTDDVRVRVEQGVVTLSGSVPDDATVRRLERLCRDIPGVHGVRNLLTVGAAPSALPADMRTPADASDAATDELGRSADRVSTDSPNFSESEVLGDLGQ